MPDYGNLTLTAKAGPAIQTTTTVFTNVTNLNLGIGARVLTFVSNGLIKTYELTGANTITITAVGGVYTLSIT